VSSRMRESQPLPTMMHPAKTEDRPGLEQQRATES
jgi:hypothetical protein